MSNTYILPLVYCAGFAISTLLFLDLLTKCLSKRIEFVNTYYQYIKKNRSFAKSHSLVSCKKLFRNRIFGRTKCSVLRYAIYQWRSTIIPLPSYRHTLVLDLDETLVYSCRYGDDVSLSTLESIGITILRDNHYVSFYVYKRPYLDAFLEAVSQWYDVVVYTAGERTYADAVLNVIDSTGRIKKRYYKDHCIALDGVLTKSIRIISPDLHSTMMIDNNPECYKLNICNAIPITSWYGDKKDKELKYLIPFLYLMRNVNDVRLVLCMNSML